MYYGTLYCYSWFSLSWLSTEACIIVILADHVINHTIGCPIRITFSVLHLSCVTMAVSVYRARRSEARIQQMLWKVNYSDIVFVNTVCVTYKKLSYRRLTARCVLSLVILPITTQQCRNYLYDKSWPNRCYEVGGLVGGNVSNKPMTVKLRISPVYRRLAVAKFSEYTM